MIEGLLDDLVILYEEIDPDEITHPLINDLPEPEEA